MKAAGVLLIFLFCLCSAEPDVEFQLTLNHHENQGTLELSLNHHENQGTFELSLNHHENQPTNENTEKDNKSNSSKNEVEAPGGSSVNEALLAKLTAMEKRLNASEELNRQNAANLAQLSSVEMRLNESQSQMEQLNRHNAANLAKLSSIDMRVNVSEDQMEQLNRHNAANLAQLSSVDMRLNLTESRVEEVNRHNEAQLSIVDHRVENVSRLITDQPKVAFSAYYLGSGSIGYSSDTTLVYQIVHSNIGNAYNPSTGQFSAPVKGVYQFRFTAGGNASSKYVWVYMYKNDQQLINNVGYNNHGDGYEYVSNGVIIELEQRDTVYMKMPGGSHIRLYDGDGTGDGTQAHNTFSGFLLYSL